MVISMLKIRRPLGRLIFNMGIAIPGKTVFLIETAPRITIWAVMTSSQGKQGVYQTLMVHLLQKLSDGRPKQNFMKLFLNIL